MKNSKLKIIAIILIILLISLISFVGIYQMRLNRLVNVVPEYKVGMDFGEIREIRLDISDETETKYFDENGNEVSEADSEKENVTSMEVAINPENIRTVENFANSKEIIEKRLKWIGVDEYQIRQDENGYFSLEFHEDDNTDKAIRVIANRGKFEIKDSDTSEVLLNNSNIKDVGIASATGDTGGVTVYLILRFDNEGKEKLAEISKTYIRTTDEEGNTVTKTVAVSIDDETILNTYFGQTIETGELQIPLNEATTSTDTLASTAVEAQVISGILKGGELPITYTITYDNVLSSTIREEVKPIIAIATAIIVVICVVYLIIRYPKGLLAGISWIGFIASFLLIIRYTNSVLSLNSVVGIVIVCVFDYIFLNAALHNKSGKTFNEVMINYGVIGIPMYIVAVIFTFASIVPISSLGIVLFWGSILMAAYNLFVTKQILEEK